MAIQKKPLEALGVYWEQSCPRLKKMTPPQPGDAGYTPRRSRPQKMPVDPRRLTPIGPSLTQPGVIHASLEMNISGGLIGYLLWMLRPAKLWKQTYDSMMGMDSEIIKKEITRAYTTTRKIGACLNILSKPDLDADHKEKVIEMMAKEDDLWHCLTVYMPFLRPHLLLEELEDMRVKANMKEGHYLDLANMLRDTVEGMKTWKATELIHTDGPLQMFSVNPDRYEEYLSMNATVNSPIRRA